MTGTAGFRTCCRDCGRQVEGYRPFCRGCGGMTDVEYDLGAARLRDSPNPYVRFFDLLPVNDPSLLPGEARFTPLIRATELGERLGIPQLWLKDETGLPTRSTKDRMAAVALPYLFESGVRRFTTSSTGNSSSAYAAAIRRLPDMRMYVVTAAGFRDRLTLPAGAGEQIVDVIARDASFVDAFQAAADLAAARGVTSETGFFNLGRREGLKLAWLETVDQLGRSADWYVQAVSSAMGVYGVAKAARELERLGVAGPPPRLLCVQQDGCAPMASAWRDGSDRIRPADIVQRPTGIATAILRGDPTRAYPHVHRALTEHGGDFAVVSEPEMRQAREQLRDAVGVDVCYAAAAALAGAARAARAGIIADTETVVVNLTGGNRPKSDVTAASYWISRTPDGWDLSAVP